MIKKSISGDQLSELVTAAQPTKTGTAPAAPPITTFKEEVLFNQSE